MNKVDQSKNFYLPIRISTLPPNTSIPFSIYLHFKDSYLEYSRPPAQIEKKKLDKLKYQKVGRFFISNKDELNYRIFMDEQIAGVIADKETSPKEKSGIVKRATEIATQHIHQSPESEESFNLTRSAANNIRKLLREVPETFLDVFDHSKDVHLIIAHSVSVCTLCIKLGEELGLKDEEIENLSTAALMHDIGLANLSTQNQEHFNTEKEELNKEQRLEYLKHVNNCTDLLRDKNYINGEIISLIQYHEENLLGNGPHKKTKLSLTQEILSLVNYYDKKILTQKISPKEALDIIKIEAVGMYDLALIQKFQKVLNDEKIADLN